ncbi:MULTISPECIES: hypothetical protein [unclassified Streptomyces]|uniref:hypothetical protein n=1 Tax=unclassified Streptomyces TaxID=2593676 RepID=UPI0038664E93
MDLKRFRAHTREAERDSIRAAGIELAPGELFAAATGTGAELEGLTGVLLLTPVSGPGARRSA